MKRKFWSFFISAGLVLSLSFGIFEISASRHAEVAPSRFPAERVVSGAFEELDQMAQFAVSRNYNALQLLRDMARNYARENVSVRFSGNDLRKLARTYSLGNDVATAFLPLNVLESVTVGSRGGQPQITVALASDTTTSFKFSFFTIRVKLARSYGIYSIGENKIGDFRGVTAEAPTGSAKILAIDLTDSPLAHVTLDRRPYPTVKVAPISLRR